MHALVFSLFLLSFPPDTEDLDYSHKMPSVDWFNTSCEEWDDEEEYFDRWAEEDREDREMASKIYLSFNFENGAYLQFSNGRTYEVAPEDRVYTISWLTPFNAEFDTSYNVKYPTMITNLDTKTSVSAKEVPAKELLKRQIELEKQKEAKEKEEKEKQQHSGLPAKPLPPTETQKTEPQPFQPPGEGPRGEKPKSPQAKPAPGKGSSSGTTPGGQGTNQNLQPYPPPNPDIKPFKPLQPNAFEPVE